MPPDITRMGTRDGRSPCLEGEGGWAEARGPQVPCLEGAGPGLGVQCIMSNGHMGPPLKIYILNKIHQL